MTKLEKLKIELSKYSCEIEKINKKIVEIENKIKLEEQKEIMKLMKDNNLTYEDLKQLLYHQSHN